MTTLTKKVATGSDDASQNEDLTSFALSATTLPAGGAQSNPSLRKSVGLRFTSVTIPQGATITSATLSLYVPNSKSDYIDVEITIESTDSALIFANTPTSQRVVDRTWTGTPVTWVANDAGIGYKSSPDIASLIQTVVDRAGWASGNHLALRLRGNVDDDFLCSFAAYEDSTAGLGARAAELSITYTAGSESKTTTGSTSLALAASGATTKDGAATGSTSLALAASGAATKDGASTATSSLVLDAPADAAKAGASTSSASFALAASGTDVKSGSSAGDATIVLAASGNVGVSEAKSTTGSTSFALGASGVAGKSVAADGASWLVLDASGTTGASEAKSATGSASFALGASSSTVKVGAPYGVAALALGSLAAATKGGTSSGESPLILTTAGVASKSTGVAAAAVLAVDVVTVAAKATATIGSTVLAYVSVGSVAIGDGTYAPDPGRTLTVGDEQRVLRVQPQERRVVAPATTVGDRVLRVQPQERTTHVAPADRRFKWR